MHRALIKRRVLVFIFGTFVCGFLKRMSKMWIGRGYCFPPALMILNALCVVCSPCRKAVRRK